MVGKISDLAPGERLFATRFMGDKGFLVTFRQVDPLFAIDLKDPSSPVLKGELKVPGFSTGLYPMQDGFLLGIGSEASEAGMITGLAMSIFDVRDLSAPKLAHKVVLGPRGSHSEAYDNPHAFRYVPGKNFVVLPISITDGNYNPTFSGFEIFQAKTDSGFQLLGQSAFPQSQSYYYDASRSFVHDDIIDMVGGGELVLRNVSSPDGDLARVAIQ
jgi:uncharacterized secreted protein with C-terminal beta-propeller domain